MRRKPTAKEVGFDHYFGKLRENIVYAELALMQLVAVTKRLDGRDKLEDDLRINLEVQEQALKDMVVLVIARLFDRKGQKGDQLSIPNIRESEAITLNEDQEYKIQRIGSLPTVKLIRSIRDNMVAHSLSHASDATFTAADLLPIINGSYEILAEIYQYNRPSQALQRADISAFSEKWSEMTKDWC